MNIQWKDSIWFFDLDDTLIDTAGAGLIASDGVYEYLATHFDREIALKIKDRFIQLFDLLLLGYRVKSDEGWKEIKGGKATYQKLLDKIAEAQPSVMQQCDHIKKWGREILIKFAGDDNDISLSPEQVHGAASAYWADLAEKVDLLKGTKKLVTTIKSHNRPVYIITSSDGRLQMQNDGTFVYNPTYSEKLKSQRVEKMKEKGLDYTAYRIGDPEDKPNLDFFEKIISAAKEDLGEIDYNNCLMFGDSYSGDLETPRKLLKFGLVVFIDHEHDGVEEIEDNYVIAGNPGYFLKWFDLKQ